MSSNIVNSGILKCTTIKFLYKLISGWVKPKARSQHKIMQPNGIELLFEEASPEKNKLGTIIFTHGLSDKGYNDEMTSKLMNSLVDIGYQVILPLYTRLCDYDISPSVIDDFLQSFQALLSHGYCTEGSVAIFAVSFSGPYVLKAACDVSIAHSISSILLLGAPYSYSSMVTHQFLSATRPNGFVRMVLSANLQKEDLPESIKTALKPLFTHLSNTNSIINMCMNGPGLDDKEKTLLNNFLVGLENGDIKETLCHEKIDDFDEQLSLQKCLKHLQATVAIIQGEEDDIIPASEGKKLYQILMKNGIKTRLTITPLIAHVHQKFSFKYLTKGNEMLNIFCFYFESINNRMK